VLQQRPGEKPAMKLTLASIVLLACVCSGHAASACDLPEPGKLSLMRRPVLGDKVHLTSGFGVRMHPILQMKKLHTGVDWAAPTGTPVVASADGRVVSAATAGEYGNTIVIDHGSGWQTLYAQLSSFKVREGDCVKANAVIGAVGTSGLSAGPHLHFEVRQNGEPVDPLSVRQPGNP
jgi:murein DD-endopeptidase MepM/ murein hydrolase activator NlpD